MARRPVRGSRAARGGLRKAQGLGVRGDLGLMQANLVKDPHQALYACKYLGKNHYEGRTRSSGSYGKLPKPKDSQGSAQYGAESGDDEEAEARRRAFEHPVGQVDRPPQPPMHADTPALRVAMIESREEDDDVPGLHVGAKIGACPSGLHPVSMGCDCEPEPEDEGVPPQDELRGTPRRKWPLRGWHETKPRRGSRLKSDAVDDEAVH